MENKQVKGLEEVKQDAIFEFNRRVREMEERRSHEAAKRGEVQASTKK